MLKEANNLFSKYLYSISVDLNTVSAILSSRYDTNIRKPRVGWFDFSLEKFLWSHALETGYAIKNFIFVVYSADEML